MAMVKRAACLVALLAVLSGVSADDFNPCLTPDNFMPDTEVPESGGSTCNDTAASFDSIYFDTSSDDFAASSKTCFAGDGTTAAHLLSDLAEYCCSDKKSVCQPYSLNPCLDPSSFQPDATFTVGGGAPCATFAGALPAFAATAETCAAPTEAFGNSSMAVMTGMAAAECCKDTTSVCSPYVMNPCENPKEFDPSTMLPAEKGEDPMSCGMMATVFLTAFEPSSETCSEPSALFLPYAALLPTMFSSCCSDGITVCSEYGVNPCEDPDTYMPGAVLPGDDGTPCSVVAALLSPFKASEETCTESISMGDSTMPRSAVLSTMSSCCSKGGAVCSGYGFNPCEDPDAYTPGAMIGDDDTPCSVLAAMLSPFEASAETCTESISMGDSTMPRSAVVSMMSSCCSTGGTVCSGYGFNPCSQPEDFKPEGEVPGDDDPTPCGMLAGMFPPLQGKPSSEQCFESVEMGDSNGTLAGIAAWMSSSCCKTSDYVCDSFVKNWCTDPKAFEPDAMLDGTPCAGAAGLIAPFKPSVETCAEKVSIMGDVMPWQTALAVFGASCCGNTSTLCDGVGDMSGPAPVPAPAPAPMTVSGELAISVSDPAAFISDESMQAVAAAAVAEMAGVPEEYVTVTLSVARRLGGSARRLAGEVKVDYVITVPADAAEGPEALAETARAAIASATPEAATTIFAEQVGDSYEVEVLTIKAPVVEAAPRPGSASAAAERGGLLKTLVLAGVGTATVLQK